MARARKISSELIHDEDYNSLSIEAQLLFIRILAVSDDCGVVPLSDHAFRSLVVPPEGIDWKRAMVEIVDRGLGHRFEHQGKPYFVFKRTSFQRHQSYIFNKRKESQYLHVSAIDFDNTVWKSIEAHMPVIWPSMAGKRIKEEEEDKGIRLKEREEVKGEGGSGGKPEPVAPVILPQDADLSHAFYQRTGRRPTQFEVKGMLDLRRKHSGTFSAAFEKLPPGCRDGPKYLRAVLEPDEVKAERDDRINKESVARVLKLAAESDARRVKK